MHGFLPLANTLQHVGGKVIIFQFFNTLLDDLTQIISLGTPRPGGEKVQPLLSFGLKANRCGHVNISGRYLYSLYHRLWLLQSCFRLDWVLGLAIFILLMARPVPKFVEAVHQSNFRISAEVINQVLFSVNENM